MNIKHRKLLNAALGLAAGIVTLPIAIFAWPILAAWFAWDETDDDDEGGVTEDCHGDKA